MARWPLGVPVVLSFSLVSHPQNQLPSDSPAVAYAARQRSVPLHVLRDG